MSYIRYSCISNAFITLIFLILFVKVRNIIQFCLDHLQCLEYWRIFIERPEIARMTPDERTSLPSSSLSSAKRFKREFRSTHVSLLMIAYHTTRSSRSNALAPIYICINRFTEPLRWSRSRVYLVTPSNECDENIHLASISYRSHYRAILCNEIMRCRFYSSLFADKDSRESRCATLRSCREKVIWSRDRYKAGLIDIRLAIAVRAKCSHVFEFHFWFSSHHVLRFDSLSRSWCRMWAR